MWKFTHYRDRRQSLDSTTTNHKLSSTPLAKYRPIDRSKHDAGRRPRPHGRCASSDWLSWLSINGPWAWLGGGRCQSINGGLVCDVFIAWWLGELSVALAGCRVDRFAFHLVCSQRRPSTDVTISHPQHQYHHRRKQNL